MKGTVALIGLRCSGKSTVGAELARGCASELRDTDRILAEREGKGRSAGEILAALGEEAFRELEEAAVREALAGPGVVATGGGVVERAATRALLAEHAFCVFLLAEVSLLARRIAEDPASRPALLEPGGDPAAELAELARRRTPLYRELADFTLDVTRLEPAAAAEEILHELRLRDLCA